MALNQKLKTYIDEQIAAGKMTQEYADRLIPALGDGPDDFQSGWLANQDYQRNMNALKTEKTQFEDQKTKWKTWEQKSNEVLATQKSEVDAAHSRIKELEAKISSGGFSDRQEGDMAKEVVELKQQIIGLQDTITKTIQGAGFVTAKELQTESAKFSGVMAEHLLSLQELNSQHMEKFGKRLTYDDNQALITYANEQSQKLGRQLNLNEAYELKYKDDIKKKEVESMRAEIEKDLQTKHNVPGGGGAPALEKGHLQIRMEKQQGKELVPGNDSLLEAKARAAEELRAEGKF